MVRCRFTGTRACAGDRREGTVVLLSDSEVASTVRNNRVPALKGIVRPKVTARSAIRCVEHEWTEVLCARSGNSGYDSEQCYRN